MVPLLKFYFHEEVRQAAVQAVPELLKSVYMAVCENKANGADMQYVKQMLDYVWQPLVEAMTKASENNRHMIWHQLHAHCHLAFQHPAALPIPTQIFSCMVICA